MQLVTDSPNVSAARSEGEPLAGRRFVILGEGRLALAVARHFLEREALVTQRPINVRTLEADVEEALAGGAECVLALSERHDANLRAALVVSRKRPELPIVIRAFDPALADEVEQDRPDGVLRVRRAYSMAHLAAPHFVAAALLDEGEEILATMRIGDDYVVACRLLLRVGEDRRGRARRLVGLSPHEILLRHGCQVIARRPADGPWTGVGEARLADGEEIVLGGRLVDVLRVARRRSRVGRHTRRQSGPAINGGRRDGRSTTSRLLQLWAHATTRSMQLLGALLVLVTLAVALTPAGGPASRFYAWVLTALGNPPRDIPGDNPVDAVVGGVGLLAGGVALGLAISLMSAYFIDRRMTETSFRRARALRGHVVVVGLGDVGRRVCQLLDRLDVPFAAVDPSTEVAAETSARAARHAGGAPVLSGTLAESLDAAGVERAAAVIACGESNLVNLEACLRAKRSRDASDVRTVARIFDDTDAARCARPLGVDRQLAAVEKVAPVFADAAVHEEAVRSFVAAGSPMLSVRWPSGYPVGRRQMKDWQADGICLLAVWRDRHGARRPPAEAPELREDEAGILAGSVDAMTGVLEELRCRTGASRSRRRAKSAAQR